MLAALRSGFERAAVNAWLTADQTPSLEREGSLTDKGITLSCWPQGA
jgi:hypothetical protein